MNQYSIPKPTLPAAAYILGAMVIVGLIGLGVAAFAAFAFIGRPVQALAFSLIVEAGMISEAIALIRRNWLSIPGLVVSLLVSGMYNFTQAERAGLLLTPPLTDPVQLAALSIGPLSAVFFLALATGRELSEHEKAVHQWEADRQKWQDDQAEKESRRQERKEARQERARVELERAAIVPAIVPGTAANVPGNVPPTKGTFEEYRAFLQANGAEHSRAELAERFHVTERCVTKWNAKLAESHPQPVMEAN